MILRRLLHGSRPPSIRSSTIFSPNETVLKEVLDHLGSRNSTILFLLSTSLPTSSLEPFLRVLNSHCPSSIGSFSIAAPGQAPSISIASFSSGSSTFQTSLSGRSDPEVGRWHRPRKVEREDLKGLDVGEITAIESQDGWAGVWNAEKDVSTIPELEHSRAKSFLVLSDNHPDPVVQAINGAVPSASAVGLMTAQTPFITGRPHTLFHNGQILSSGSVGIAIEEKLSTDIDYRLEPLTEVFPVSRAQGNLLLNIDDGGEGNPARTLINALHRHKGRTGITKEEEWFLSIHSDGSGEPDNVVKILSGDPSRGVLSLETEISLRKGQSVQFLHRTQAIETSEPRAGVLAFATLHRDHHSVASEVSAGDARVVDGFVGHGEDGIIHGQSICKVPGAIVSAK
ncbi:hypothetical protein BD324DRAFT_621048 [Kockovaella imperatae]|uniref:FIST domain-containing protein n=1 Tax=Kockovaella imperatae TaxID=4999 RepID=A0A1Y1ULT2_9TREE|nr:hypothetical protein BD324DRAFT_621048 [Kockovaella imperatae]ORX38487.1 hypothetical protein BD324DRAFT_621048 [Kockovaella imperatae]